LTLFVGIDHSLTAFGLAAVHTAWGCDPKAVRRHTLATPPGPLVERRMKLARDALIWVERQSAALGVLPGSIRVFIEGGIFMRGKAETIRSQERLAGVVEHEFFTKHAIVVEHAEQRAARSVFMGKSLSGGRGAGDVAQALMREVVGLAWDEAELDAFVVANYGLSLAGEAFISCAPSQAVAPKKRGRRAA
jgi:hypothetical protein